MAKSKITSLRDAFDLVAQGLKTSAVRPNIYGYVPHEKQLEFHTSNSKVRLFIGGNRSGKTVAGATEIVWWATGKHPYLKTPEPPVRCRVIAVDINEGIEQITRPEVARWLPLSELKGSSWEKAYSKEQRELTLANGSTVEFMSYEMDVDKFAGTSRHLIWMDEEPPEDIFKENLARTIDVGGRILISMTPLDGLSWTYEGLYLAGKTNPNVKVVEVDMTENPHLNPAEIQSFLAGLDDDEKKARVHGRYVQMGGRYYDKYLTDRNILDPFVPSKEWLWVVGMDAGYTNPTVFLWAAVDADGRIFVFDEHYESQKLPSEHAVDIHAKNKSFGKEPDYYVGDPSIRNIDPITGTSLQLEYMEVGIPIILGNNDQRAGISRVQNALKGDSRGPRLFITRNCVNLLYELPRLRQSVWAHRRLWKTRNKKEEQHKHNDHASDALRYLVASRPQMDSGLDVPQVITPESLGIEASSAINPYKRYAEADFAGVNPEFAETADYNLGAEY